MRAPPLRLEPALAALPARHRRIVAETIGADRERPGAIASVLRDDARLEALVRALPDEARAATTALAFAAVDLWSPPGAARTTRATFDRLERHGLALCFDCTWSLSYLAPLDLVPSLRRVRARAHAARIEDAPAPARSLAPTEQLPNDAAAVGARIVHGGIRVKADGELSVKARKQLATALPPLPIPLPGLDAGERRAELALMLLREVGALQVSRDDLPGRSTRRELRVDADLPGLLDRPFDDRVELTRLLRREFADLALIDPLLDALDGRIVTLSALGEALTDLFAEARKQPATAAGATPAGIGMAAAYMRWLCGGAAIGFDADGRPTTVKVGAEPPPQPDGPPCVLQADFELLTLRRPLPHERAAMLLVGEPVPSREHVARVTRERIHSAIRAPREHDAGAILGNLRALAGTLPQNVERSVADWARQAPPRARLRAAIFVDLDGELADALGPLVAERLAPHLLAVRAGELAEVDAALRKVGVELEPGLDRVSGPWTDTSGDQDRHDHPWRPSSGGERTAPPAGQLTSRIDEDAPAPPSAAIQAAQRQNDRFGIDLDLQDVPLDDELEPGEVLLESFELGAPVELCYAGAGGTIVEHVTVEELDGARFLVADADTGARRWRWIRAVLEARLAAD
jgi:hypothetical protein